MNIWYEFLEIFTQMTWIPALLLCLGFVLLVIEVFVPGFGFFGITGSLCVIAGIVVRICYGLNVTQSAMLILLVFIFFAVCVVVMVHSAQHGMLGKTGLFENKTSLSQNYNEPDKSLNKLVGKTGKTIGVLNLGGKAKINGKTYDVVSEGGYIEADANVEVVEIKNNTIIVRKSFE